MTSSSASPAAKHRPAHDEHLREPHFAPLHTPADAAIPLESLAAPLETDSSCVSTVPQPHPGNASAAARNHPGIVSVLAWHHSTAALNHPGFASTSALNHPGLSSAPAWPHPGSAYWRRSLAAQLSISTSAPPSTSSTSHAWQLASLRLQKHWPPSWHLPSLSLLQLLLSGAPGQLPHVQVPPRPVPGPPPFGRRAAAAHTERPPAAAAAAAVPTAPPAPRKSAAASPACVLERSPVRSLAAPCKPECPSRQHHEQNQPYHTTMPSAPLLVATPLSAGATQSSARPGTDPETAAPDPGISSRRQISYAFQTAHDELHLPLAWLGARPQKKNLAAVDHNGVSHGRHLANVAHTHTSQRQDGQDRSRGRMSAPRVFCKSLLAAHNDCPAARAASAPA
mmetsp:Transcript_79857/g.138567  ORF Transcript_79857/g.138567 Transcript_79857/m.138567 type:complete len:395 (-) Transcript_79857:234-1418(-)